MGFTPNSPGSSSRGARIAVVLVAVIAVVVALIAVTRERTEPCPSLAGAQSVVLASGASWTLPQSRFRVELAVNRHLFSGLQLRLPEGVYATVTLTPEDGLGKPLVDGALLANVQAECIRLQHQSASWQTRLREGERTYRLIAAAGPGPQWPVDDHVQVSSWVRVSGQLYELQFGEVVIGGAHF